MVKLEKILFFVFIFSIPFQLRDILFQVGSFFNEYNAGFIYFTDLLILVLFFLWLSRLWRANNKIEFLNYRIYDIFLILFFVIGLISLIFTVNFSLGFYQLLKLAELLFIYFYIKSSLSLVGLNSIATAFVFSGIFQSIVAFFQFFLQKNLGLWFLGESLLNPNMAGVAKFFSGEGLFMRSYGTFPHPNILSSFLVFSLFFLFWIAINNKEKEIFTSKKINLVFFSLCSFLLVLGIFFSFSRVSLAAFLMLFCIYLVLNLKDILSDASKKYFFGIFIFLVIFTAIVFLYFFGQRFGISLNDQAISLRGFYSDIALKIIYSNFILGAGLGNFVLSEMTLYPGMEEWMYQPAHNFYLLLLAEVGLLGFTAFFIFLYFLIKEFLLRIAGNKNYNLFFLLFLYVILFAFFDHFFWTIQQGRLTFWILLGILSVLDANNG